MTESERQELEQCSLRIAELLYQEALEQNTPLSTLGEIETTVRAQLQTYISPTIGAFFVQPSVERKKDILAPSTVSSVNLNSPVNRSSN